MRTTARAPVQPGSGPPRKVRRTSADGSVVVVGSLAVNRVKVTQQLAQLLLDDASAVETELVTDAKFERAFIEYTQLLGNLPTALHREWSTKHNVLQALNGLQGQNIGHVFSGIQTTAGYALYLAILKDQSNGNRRKPSDAQVATTWNRRVEAMLSGAGSEAEREAIRLKYGFVSAGQVYRHKERLAVRVDQTAKADSLNVGGRMMDLCQSIKESRAPVGAMDPSGALPSSYAPGVGTAMQTERRPSALVAVRPAQPASLSTLSLEELKNTCFLCALNSDRWLEECQIQVVNGGVVGKHYTNGHGRTKKKVRCDWFAELEGTPAEKKAKIDAASRARELALQARRRKDKHAASDSALVSSRCSFSLHGLDEIGSFVV